MRVERIGYVGLRTNDVDAMTSFFRDVIGLEDAGEGETVTFQQGLSGSVGVRSDSCSARGAADARVRS